MENGRFTPRATGFFVTSQVMECEFLSFVTAEHVVSGLLTKNLDLYARVNLVNGDVAIAPIPPEHWHFHPDVAALSDVAVCSIDGYARQAESGEAVQFDIAATSLSGERAIPASADTIAEHNIGVGDEVFIVGLFRSHSGHERNRPIVRVGNIAAMRDEPVWTRYAGHTDAYLIEAMSIGGLSGSPVYVHMPPVRSIEGSIRVAQGKQY
jgi:hypothetical protein